MQQLSQLEALVLINRWAKKDNFYRADIEKLYQLKHQQVFNWYENCEMIPTKIVVRESYTIGRMKQEVTSGGRNLLFFHNPDYQNFFTDEEKQHYYVLQQFCNHQYMPSLSRMEYESQLKAYQLQMREYEAEILRRANHPVMLEYRQAIVEWSQGRIEAAKAFAPGQKFTRGWIRRLEKQGFRYEQPQPKCPSEQFPPPPQKPQPPTIDWSQVITPANYTPGAIAEIENALAWARTILPEVPNYQDLDDEFIYNLEQACQNLDLDRTLSDVLDTFRRVVNHELTDPKEIYYLLTMYDIDYEDAIGMKHIHAKRWHESEKHYDFNKWHEINLSPTGYWLVEFQSTLNSDIIFHVPYDKCQGIDLQSLPKIPSEQANYGREISEAEAKDYPLESLLAIFGLTKADFPYNLNLHLNWYCDDED